MVFQGNLSDNYLYLGRPIFARFYGFFASAAGWPEIDRFSGGSGAEIGFIKSAHMKYLYFAIGVLALLSCSKAANYTTCNLNYTAPTGLDTTRQVQYLAVLAGSGGTITSLSYLDSTGTITVKNPTLPFSASTTLKKGTIVTMSLAGTANHGGSINMSVTTDSVSVITCGN